MFEHTSRNVKFITVKKSWQRVVIPISFFEDGIINLRKLGTITILTANSFNSKTISKVYIDNLGFNWEE